MPKLLTSEKVPWMALLFGYLAMPTILATFFFGYQIVDAVPNILRGEPQVGTICIETIPRNCYEYDNYSPPLPNIGYLITSIAISVLIWSIGFRYRAVWLEDNGSLKITWGEKTFPVTIKKYGSKSLSDFTITQEQRFIISGGTNRVGRAPDRWRVKAMHAGHLVNIGSFASEVEAQKTIALLS